MGFRLLKGAHGEPEFDPELQAFIKAIHFEEFDTYDPESVKHVAWDGVRWSKAHYDRLLKESIVREWNECGGR